MSATYPHEGSTALDGLKLKRLRRIRLSLLAAALDMALIAIAYLFASLLYLGSLPSEQVGRVLVVLLPIFLFFNLNNQSYSAAILLDGLRSTWRGTSGLIWASLLMFLIFFMFKISEEFSRAVLGLGTILAASLIWIGRLIVSRIGTQQFGRSPFALMCIYDEVEPVGGRQPGTATASELGLLPHADDPEMLDRLGKLALGIDGIVLHCPAQKRAQWAFMLKSLDVPTEIVTPELTQLHPLAVNQREGQTSLVLGSGQLSWSHRVLKRSFDLLVTVAFLPVLLPVLLIVALAVKLDSPGPALFRQERIGLGNRKFWILKFRTMRVDMQDDRAEKITERSDPRVTRVGDFLRRTSIDELPQFLNVLSGDMSIVGPRPHAESTLAGSLFTWEVDSAYWHRHVVKPGITGLAQVRGYRGSMFEEQHLRDRLNADLEYVANWSLAGDLRIILLTLNVLVHKNAF